MTAIVTDPRYRMSLAVIRDLGEKGVRVVCCETAAEKKPVGAASRYCLELCVLPEGAPLDALYELCDEITRAEGEKPALLPVGAGTLAVLSEPETAGRFRKVCGLLIPTKAALDTLNDKESAAKLARRLGIPTPEEYDPSTARFPCVVKPRCGEKFGLHAAQRYKIANNAAELAAFREHFRSLTGEEPLIQQYLPGRGMGCSVIAENGRVRRALCHLRIREYPVSGGPSSCAQALRNEKLEDWTAKLMAETGFSGPCMVEFKLDADGQPRLLEVNPRVWGTYPLTRAAKAGFSWEWFRLAWNDGNPEKPLPPEDAAFRGGKRMAFTASDMAAAVGYFRAGKRGLAMGAVTDFASPLVSDGVWEWRDVKPAVRYYASLLRKGGE